MTTIPLPPSDVRGVPQLAHAARLDDDRAEVRWAGGTVSTYWSFWLRILATDTPLFADTSADWTDGSNFAPQETVSGAAEQLDDIVVAAGGEQVEVRWRDGHRATLSARRLWLAEHDDPAAAVPRAEWGAGKQWATWSYEEVVEVGEPAAVRGVLEAYLRDGVAMLSGVPRRRDALATAGARLARVSSTHLDDLFDIRPEAKPRHIGEVAAAVPVHIDLIYRQEPPTIQALHALRQVARGGENIFVDALAVTGQLDPADVQLLTTPVDFVARSNAVHFRGRHPVLRLDADGRFAAVAYNQYKIVFPASTPRDFAAALGRFRALVERPDNVVTFQLPQDHIVLFDNRRVLHGRLPFDDLDRHLVGCYLSEDDLRSRYRMLVASA